MGENERETREEKTFVRNGSRKWHGNVQDGAGTVTVTNTVSNAVVTWHKHVKADQ